MRSLQLAVAVAALASAAHAQDAPPRGAIRIAGGYAVQYIDEPWRVSRSASIRFYVAPRLSIEPELTVSPGPNFAQWTFIPNIAWDLRDSLARVVPYLIGGVGYFRDTDKSILYRRREVAWTAGMGLRVALGGRIFAAPEFRCGHISRLGIGIGYLF
jgi:hypothetical protein